VQDVDNVCAHMLRNGYRDFDTIEWQEARGEGWELGVEMAATLYNISGIQVRILPKLD